MHWNYLNSETDFQNEILKENGRNRITWIQLAKEYLRNINKPENNDQNNFKNTNRDANSWLRTYKKCKRKYIKIVLTLRGNLNSILFRNTSKLLLNCYPRGYPSNHTCNTEYIGEAKKNVMTRTIEHQQSSIKEIERLSCDRTLLNIS